WLTRMISSELSAGTALRATLIPYRLRICSTSWRANRSIITPGPLTRPAPRPREDPAPRPREDTARGRPLAYHHHDAPAALSRPPPVNELRSSQAGSKCH